MMWYQFVKGCQNTVKMAKTVDVAPQIQYVLNGSYYHFGILAGIEWHLQKLSQLLVGGNSIGLQINVDGVHCTKAQTISFGQYSERLPLHFLLSHLW